ncbi:MAG: tetraacyldisaccharide 4'-kinase [Magnetococcales bacterium]|nr:tetraacyldisaccharide 4'-kinase [Magnetococcales bacterium]
MQRLLPWLTGAQPPESPTARLLLSGLAGVGALLGGVQLLKARLHRHHHLSSLRAPCPVISVGNLTVGGTGKTPMVCWLAQHLSATGRRIAVVSRGYRQHSRSRVTVVADPEGIRLAPPMAADEAVLLAHALPGVAILTGADRPALIRHALEQFGCNLILMDDGFHRLDVDRDLDLVLLDARRPFGNGRVLPGGILREFPSALHRCDGIILTRADDPDATRATLNALTHRFPDKPLLTAIHRPSAWIPIHPDGPARPLDALTGPVLAFCGIGTPEGFQRALHALPVRLTGFHPFPDHHPFTPDTLRHLSALAQSSGAHALVCTEKDAVKLNRAALSLPLFALRVTMELQHNRSWLEQRLAFLDRSPSLFTSGQPG